MATGQQWPRRGRKRESPASRSSRLIQMFLFCFAIRMRTKCFFRTVTNKTWYPLLTHSHVRTHFQCRRPRQQLLFKKTICFYFSSFLVLSLWSDRAKLYLAQGSHSVWLERVACRRYPERATVGRWTPPTTEEWIPPPEQTPDRIALKRYSIGLSRIDQDEYVIVDSRRMEFEAFRMHPSEELRSDGRCLVERNRRSCRSIDSEDAVGKFSNRLRLLPSPLVGKTHVSEASPTNISFLILASYSLSLGRRRRLEPNKKRGQNFAYVCVCVVWFEICAASWMI